MNNERAIFAIGGLVVGGIAGTLITTAYLKKAFEDKLNKAVADVKSVYMSRNEDTVSSEETLVEQSIESVEEEVTESEFDVDAYEAMLRETSMSKSTKIVDEVDPLSYIHVIDLDSFLAEPEPDWPDWEKVSLMYFEEDDTLCDHNYMFITEADHVVGPDFREWFGQLSEDENTVFIRNDNTRTDYEVMREEGTYLDAAGN